MVYDQGEMTKKNSSGAYLKKNKLKDNVTMARGKS